MQTKELTCCAFSAACITLCSWISIPLTIPFTLQTLAIFFICGALGGRIATCSIILYLLLGCIGIPVFSGFRQGFSTLFSMTGGYIFGFLLSSLLLWSLEKWWKDHTVRFFFSCLFALMICYLCGTLWFAFLNMQTTEPLGILSIIALCVLPYLLPDLLKILIAIYLIKRLRIFFITK